MPQDSPEQELRLPLVRSLPSRSPVHVVFCNRSPRVVVPVWINFRGEPQRYEPLRPWSGRRMNTFVGHPWMFRDAESDDPMCVNNKELYLPRALDNGQTPQANITLPVWTLRERCLQVVRKYVQPQHFPQLEIAQSLQQDLADRPSSQRDLLHIARRVEQRLLQEQQQQHT
ncbi:von Hippel-Lindau disease tumor suppressor [Denticeps clupeoides]|uniref:von Hippel-Lindau disease tumor suppressor n=1 Tax=Denticeps clupeoides TaxID=299321 RepID=A0AAY4CZJ9_9TELE|nr:von Hippel-Lindau disease tumor suppressor-like [Denticeps clupeoides]